ncbi:hypothetical protein HAX54_027240, partial [Datura stramonium]|nr:hypothetical protein [Datura stramonium]
VLLSSRVEIGARMTRNDHRVEPPPVKRRRDGDGDEGGNGHHMGLRPIGVL